MSELLNAQFRFSRMLAQLLGFAHDERYEVTMGECWRPPEMAEIDAAKGAGIAHSLHTDRLAVDINLFKDGQYLDQTVQYEPLGEFWESLGGAWGGRFTKPDGNHFSISWGGRK